MARNTKFLHLKTYQLALWILFGMQQGCFTNEVPLLRLDDPTQSCFVQGNILTQFVSIKVQSTIQAQTISCTETTRLDAKRGTCF